MSSARMLAGAWTHPPQEARGAHPVVHALLALRDFHVAPGDGQLLRQLLGARPNLFAHMRIELRADEVPALRTWHFEADRGVANGDNSLCRWRRVNRARCRPVKERLGWCARQEPRCRWAERV